MCFAPICISDKSSGYSINCQREGYVVEKIDNEANGQTKQRVANHIKPKILEKLTWYFFHRTFNICRGDLCRITTFRMFEVDTEKDRIVVRRVSINNASETHKSTKSHQHDIRMYK
jgi:hypothetical protein